MQRRTAVLAPVALLAASTVAGPARALMSGTAPDSPRARLDPVRPDSPFACVAGITGGGGIYSGVCITRRHVLTAGHVGAQAGELMVYLNVDRDLSHRLAVRRMWRHPALEQGFDPQRPVGDLAVLELADDVPGVVALPPLAATPVHEGMRLELVGHGSSGPGDGRQLVAAHPALRRRGANVVDAVLRSTDAARVPLIYLFRFDPPGSPGSLGNAVETGLASGDSGGPAFVMARGRPALAGINTFVRTTSPKTRPDYRFGTLGGGQALAGHAGWLRSVLGRGTWPGLEG